MGATGYTPEFKADGIVERMKACLIAKGYTKSYVVDYFETFSLVANFNTISVLIALAAKCHWDILQFEVKMHSPWCTRRRCLHEDALKIPIGFSTKCSMQPNVV